MEQSSKNREHQQPLLEGDADFELSQLNGHASVSAPYEDAYHKHPPKPIAPWLIATALVVTIAGLVIQTEAIAYYEDVLGWSKPFSSLYVTHGTLVLPWLCHVVYLRFSQRDKTLNTWVRNYTNELKDAITSVDAFAVDGPPSFSKHVLSSGKPLGFILKTMAVVTVALTMSGMSWFGALAFTTPGDLTAIYNCSAFFAAAFSVPLLKQSLSWWITSAVALSIIGTIVIAYGDSGTAEQVDETASEPHIGSARLFGNLIALVGAVAFGLYEVLFKKWACSSGAQGGQASLALTLFASALTGFYTLFVLWIGVILLHFLEVEVFVLPSIEVCAYIATSVAAGSIAITSLLILVTWTNPVFGSVTSVLSVFFVAIADWLLFGLAPSLATYVGGALIMIAFGLLVKDEMASHKT